MSSLSLIENAWNYFKVSKSSRGMTSIHYVMVAVAGIVAVALVLAATSAMNENIIASFVDSVNNSDTGLVQ